LQVFLFKENSLTLEQEIKFGTKIMEALGGV